MKVLIDVNHPAHVHFFKQPARKLLEKGCELVFTSRDKECCIALLDELEFEHQQLSTLGDGSVLGFIKELFIRNFRLYRLAKTFRPDVMCAIGGTFIAHAGFLSRVPRLAFYDTEMARLQNKITYPLLTRLCVPNCYTGPTPRHTSRYPGYHELSYLRPEYFSPDRQIAEANGWQVGSKNYLLRAVSWQANHDLNEQGWSLELLEAIFDKLLSQGNVIISSERPLPARLEPYRYSGRAADIHHMMAFCDLFVGESSTMAAECAVLGVPAVYAASSSRGYLDELQEKYGLVKVLTHFKLADIEQAVNDFDNMSREQFNQAKQALLDESIDVAAYVVDTIEAVANLR
jgi:predicted glycosyltransferase